MEIYEKEGIRHAREEKRLKKQREKKEVKLMFGQMEKDGRGLMEWVKETEEAAQLASSDTLPLLHPALHTSLPLYPALY